jgi:hypothetical protein
MTDSKLDTLARGMDKWPDDLPRLPDKMEGHYWAAYGDGGEVVMRRPLGPSYTRKDWERRRNELGLNSPLVMAPFFVGAEPVSTKRHALDCVIKQLDGCRWPPDGFDITVLDIPGAYGWRWRNFAQFGTRSAWDVYCIERGENEDHITMNDWNSEMKNRGVKCPVDGGNPVHLVGKPGAAPATTVYKVTDLDMIDWQGGEVLKDFISAAKKPEHHYHVLASVLLRAYERAVFGKGKGCHAQDLPFGEQPMQQISRLAGSHDGLVYQAIKKIQESQRLDHDAAIRELLGAIVYTAGNIVYQEGEVS